MHFGTLTGGITVDFADVLLIINVCAIAMLLGVLYVDEIIAAFKRASHFLNPHSLYRRMRFWVDEYRASH